MAYTDQHLYFDDMEEGQFWESAGRTITETDIVNFAGVSGDYNPIHVDDEFAAKTPLRKRVAHGLLVLSIGSGLSIQHPAVRTVLVSEIRELYFREPVFVGDTIKTRSTVLTIEPRSRNRRADVTWKREVVNQHGKVVQEAIAVTLVEGRALHAHRKKPSSSSEEPVSS